MVYKPVRVVDGSIDLIGAATGYLSVARQAAADLPDEGTVPALVNRDGNARFVAIKL